MNKNKTADIQFCINTFQGIPDFNIFITVSFEGSSKL